MKPYFAKYLPVEGDSGLVMTIYDTVYPKKDVPIEKIKNNIKLFLCSRDIQVGDIARNINRDDLQFTISEIEMGSGENYFPQELLVWYKWDEVHYWLKAENCYKVIGQISPNAKWVKPDDEFDEDQIMSERPFKDYAYIQIKCPCCETFK